MESTTTNNKYNPQEYIKQADEVYLGLVKAGGYEHIIAKMADLGGYTLRNQMLIQMQKPEASNLNTMKTWNYFKRSIVKGAESIKILAPIFDKKITTGENGEIVEKTNDYASGYEMKFLFDESQTTGEPIEKLINNKTVTDEFDTVKEGLIKSLKDYSFEEKDMDSEGMLDTRKRTITLKSGMDKDTYLKALIKQVSAALVVGRNRNNFQGIRSDEVPNIASIEITGISNILSKKLGLKSEKLIEPDFTKMEDNQIKKFANNIGVMRSISQIMILAIENALSERALEQKLEQAKAAEKETEKTTTKTAKVKTTAKTRVKAEAELC